MKSLDRKRTSGRNGYRNRMDWKKNMRKKKQYLLQQYINLFKCMSFRY